MANSSFVISLSTAISSETMTSNYLLAGSNPRNEAMALSSLFKRIADGLTPASFQVQYGAVAPVAAFGTLTLTYASIANLDTCVVAGTTLTCVTGTPAGAQFKKEVDATTTAANLVALINSNATTSAIVWASSVAGVVTITAQVPGTIGNKLTLVGSTGMVASGAVFTTGAGGASSVPVNYARS